jgi:hypothetical protein
MLRCRSQEELHAGMTTDLALVTETKFFLANEPWNKCNTLMLGSEKLVKRLISIFVTRIQVGR